MTRRILGVLPVLVALPILGGAGVCGNVLVDIAQRELILDPISEVTFEVDRGSIEVYAFDRNGVVLLDHMVGSLHDIGDSFYEVAADRLEVVSECDRSNFCTIDWYAEVPEGTAVDARTRTGDVKLSSVTGPIVVEIEDGTFEGVRLHPATLRVDVQTGGVDAELLAMPEAILIEVGTGDVSITLPPGSYRCDLAAPDGEIETQDVVCDPMADAVLEVTVASGNITLLAGATS